MIACILALKAFGGCIWYHYRAKCNRVKFTYEIFFIRMTFDLLVLACCFLYYFFASVDVMTLTQLILSCVLFALFEIF